MVISNPKSREISRHVNDYQSAAKFLGNKGSRKLANNTKVYRVMLRGYYGLVDEIHVRLHNTDIVSYREDGIITLNSGGYQTTTTKQRMNQLLPPGYSISQTKYKWYLRTPEGEVPFVDGMTLTPAGGGFGSRRIPNPDVTGKRKVVNGTTYRIERLGIHGWAIKADGTVIYGPTEDYDQVLREWNVITAESNPARRDRNGLVGYIDVPREGAELRDWKGKDLGWRILSNLRTYHNQHGDKSYAVLLIKTNRRGPARYAGGLVLVDNGSLFRGVMFPDSEIDAQSARQETISEAEYWAQIDVEDEERDSALMEDEDE